jgi:hypothetical protein
MSLLAQPDNGSAGSGHRIRSKVTDEHQKVTPDQVIDLERSSRITDEHQKVTLDQFQRQPDHGSGQRSRMSTKRSRRIRSLTLRGQAGSGHRRITDEGTAGSGQISGRITDEHYYGARAQAGSLMKTKMANRPEQ